MFLSYTPTWTIEAIYNIKPEEFLNKGIKGVLVDLDNTLVAWNNPDGTKELHHWIQEMKAAKIPVVVVSNNKASRIQRVVNHLGLPFVSRALKPFTKGLKEASELLQLPKEELVMVGDQLMTDIKAANQFGMASILVKPLVESDAWNTKFNRQLEKMIKRKIYPQGISWERNLKNE